MLDYHFFEKYYKIAKDLSKQQKLDVNPKAIQQIDFTGHPEWAGNTKMFFIIEDAKETVLDFSQGTVRVLWIRFVLIEYQYKMTKYNILNIKLPNSQLNELKLGIRNCTEVNLKFWIFHQMWF